MLMLAIILMGLEQVLEAITIIRTLPMHHRKDFTTTIENLMIYEIKI